MRIGTAEREEAMGLLSRQFSEGRLNPDEFSERSAANAAATTGADLEPVLADLPARPGAATASGIERARAWLTLPILGILLYR